MANKNISASKSNILVRVLSGFILIALSIYIFWILHKGAGLHPSNLNTQLGFIGGFLYRLTHSMTGQLGFLVPLFVLGGGIQLAVPRFSLNRHQVIGIVGFCLLLLAWKHLLFDLDESIAYGRSGIGGGVIGAGLSYMMVKLFGVTGARLLIIALMIVMIYIGTEGRIIKWIRSFFVNVKPKVLNFIGLFKNFVFVEEDKQTLENTESTLRERKAPNLFSKLKKSKNNTEPSAEAEKNKKSNTPTTDKRVSKPKINTESNSPTIFIDNLKEFQEELIEEEKKQRVKQYVESGFAEAAASKITSPDRIYHLPDSSLLEDIAKKGLHIDQDEIDNNAGILEQTLSDFGVKGRISEVSVGPTITEYEFQPAPGIKVSKILNLSDDLALSLATSGIRIQAPIPGKAAVGIEVPNKKARVVRIKEIITSEAFQSAESRLTVALGKDISGKSMVTDLAKMPHLLIAGSTGSGKSVCLNALIMSILYKAKPYEVKFLMIDPKMVELGNYNGIPHLLAPVVTDSKKAAATLRWAVKEMEKRYEKFAETGAKDIRRYNEKCLEKQALGDYSEETELMPKIVIIIDELADLMMVAPADVEDAICRLAQMARAAGMHLVIATQRPSVDVITGIIKANIPSRIAFAVSSQVDSRTILDMGGAEKLLGRGDMLFYPTGIAKPKRIQGVFVTDDEIDAVVEFIKKQAAPEYDDEVVNTEFESVSDATNSKSEEQDELLPDACRLFIENGQASISMLQRHFRIGYTRAARIIDELERLGYVGPYEGSKPRQIKISLEEYNRVFKPKED